MSAIIEFQRVSKVFRGVEIDTYAVNEIDMVINKGEYVALSGPSGCGKSTMLSLLGLLDAPTEGTYLLNGMDVTSLNARQKASVRNKEIGFIFQSFNLISDLTVAENVELPLSYRSGMSKSQRIERVNRVLDRVEMLPRAKHYPWQLSGGQQQRVAVARALVGEPSILLADEPTGNLDSKNAEIVMDLLDLLHKEGATICLVTHDPRSADHASRIIRLADGAIEKVLAVV